MTTPTHPKSTEERYVDYVMCWCDLRPDYPGYAQLVELVRRCHSFGWPAWSAVDRVFQVLDWPRPWRRT